MKVTYYRADRHLNNLCCRISDEISSVFFDLGYSIIPENWNSDYEETSYDDPYHHVLLQFKLYLDERYHELIELGVLPVDVLVSLKNEAEEAIKNAGVDGLACKLFDRINQPSNIPAYNQFIQAFEQFSCLKRLDYNVSALTSVVQFSTAGGKVWEIDTHAGLTTRLKEYVEGRLVSEIRAETAKDIWSRIYANRNIEKYVFIPKFVAEWERYWCDEYASLQQMMGEGDHLDQLKQVSWRRVQVFMSCYDNTCDIINLAHQISSEDLYPLVVLTMLALLDSTTCYALYCKFEFTARNGWKLIRLRKNAVESNKVGTSVRKQSSVFFIRETMS
ncbi:hypothetical protein CLV58_13537 [Spirosoma oryzae]|uniref:Uncharacterized protein n=1 Tax=Spirosoma oryzae TaxID=1469603 RepID=A0A2T0S0U6_9BACT|nr:hypothetical protein [Spirosoma oryzae]PRY27035.1 hypothetical protein CLV58_13537 [Spirosoma oryzae]